MVVVHFSPAYFHKSKGRPGFDAGTGWVQEAKLFFSEAFVGGDLPDWPCDVMGGEMTVGGERHENLIPVPPDAVRTTVLRLTCDPVHTVTVAGRSVRLELVGEARHVEEFRPQNPPA